MADHYSVDVMEWEKIIRWGDFDQRLGIERESYSLGIFDAFFYWLLLNLCIVIGKSIANIFLSFLEILKRYLQKIGDPELFWTIIVRVSNLNF